MNLTSTESLILRASLAVDAQVAQKYFREWMTAWERQSNAPWNTSAPDSELSLLGRVSMHDGVIDMAGSTRSTLIGLRRLNWALSTRQAVLFEEFAQHLTAESPIMLLKGAALRLLGKSPFERRHSDIDFAVPPDRVHSVLGLLRSLNFLPSQRTDFNEISSRLLHRRDGWNFEHPSGLNLDLHWRVFEHRGQISAVDPDVWNTASIHKLPLSHTDVLVPSRSTLGVYTLYHAFVRGTTRDRLQHLLDLADVVDSGNIQATHELAARLDLGDELLDRIRLVQQLGASVSTWAIEKQATHREQPPAEPWLQRTSTSERRSWSLAVARSRMRPRAETLEVHLLRNPIAYRVWSALGYPSIVERVLIRRRALAKAVTPDRSRERSAYSLAELEDRNAILGPGWSWRGINEDFVWSDRLESRVIISTMGVKSGELLVEFSSSALNAPRQDGRFSCSPTGDIYTNGVKRASYDFALRSQPLLVKIPYKLRKNQTMVEISFRPTSLVNHRNLGPVYQSWKQSVPLRSVSLLADNSSCEEEFVIGNHGKNQWTRFRQRRGRQQVTSD